MIIKTEEEGGIRSGAQSGQQQQKKPRKKHNRFNGMSEEEVAKRLLPDLIKEDLDILIVSKTCETQKKTAQLV